MRPIHRIAAPILVLVVLIAIPAIAAAGSQGDVAAADRWERFSPPPWLIWHGAAYDAPRNRMIVFGGTNGLQLMDELWELSLGDNPGWRKLQASGTAPLPISRFSMVLDPLRDRILVFGARQREFSARLSQRDLVAVPYGDPVWTVLATAGTPPTPRAGRQMAYDSIGDRLIVFGGIGDNGTLNDVWSLPLAGVPAWTPLSPTGIAPEPRYNGSLVFDPTRNRVILFGGLGQLSPSSTERNDTWELTSQARPAGTRSPQLGRSRMGVPGRRLSMTRTAIACSCSMAPITLA
jgi:hypothetical protein